MRARFALLAAAFSTATAPSAQAPSTMLAVAPLQSAPSIPLVTGLTLVSTLHTEEGDRENVIGVGVSPGGVTYSWHYRERTSAGDSSENTAQRFVSAGDMASAPRMNTYFRFDQLEETPGYTAFTISRAIFNRVRAEREVRYTTTGVDSSALLPGTGTRLVSRVPYRGTLSLVSANPEPVSVLVNGRRTAVPTIHLRGRFAYQNQRLEYDLWVLADSTHPLVLRTVRGARTYQTVRIDFPDTRTAEVAERDLERNCRVELPGVYFAFASAELEPASEPALKNVAALLARHPDWSFVIEGHTDSIGGPASNLELSKRRAEAVRAALVQHRGIAPGRLQSAGYGATRPRESNATLEGRARNRRVELSRECADGTR